MTIDIPEQSALSDELRGEQAHRTVGKCGQFSLALFLPRKGNEEVQTMDKTHPGVKLFNTGKNFSQC